MCLSLAAVCGEYKDSGGGVPGLVDWSKTSGEGAGLFIPVIKFDGDLECHLSPK